MMNEDRTCAEN